MQLEITDDLLKFESPAWKQAFTGNHFDISENAAMVLSARYLQKTKTHVIENFEGVLNRVSKTIASVEKKGNIKKWTDKFYSLMASRRFIPGSPTIMNAGRPGNNALPACFVIAVEDDLAHTRDSIFGAMMQMAGIHKAGGGTGSSFGRLRPMNDRVSSTNGAASGPISFMHAYNTVIQVVMQGGMRRGAHMSIMPVDHPDIMDFIRCKGELLVMEREMFNTMLERINMKPDHPIAKALAKVIIEYQLKNMNISVGITRDFKKALIHDGVYFLKNPKNGEIVAEHKAREVFNLICEYAHKNGEPGIVDLDRINQDNPLPNNPIESTNPCGEQPLEPFESCNLGSIVLPEHIKRTSGGVEINWPALQTTAHESVRFLDNVIDATPYPYPHIEKKTKANRKIGLGVMGFADILFEMGIAYDSAEAVSCCSEIHAKLTTYAREASHEIAKEKGAFPDFKKSVFAGGKEYRNATTTTDAPTGSISTIADCSPGIEPVFKLAYKRNILEGKALVQVDSRFLAVAKERRFDHPEVMQKIAETGSCRGVEGVPEDVQRIFATALDVPPETHVHILCAAQGTLNPEEPDGVENAVSKTVNVPYEAKVHDIADIFTRVIQGGGKGVTVYRSGSRDVEVFTSMKSARYASLIQKRPRPKDEMPSLNYRIPLPCGDFYFTIVPDEFGKPFEIFHSPEHKMDCVDSGITQLCRQISLSLRCGIGIEDITKQHLGVRCTKCEEGIGFGERKVFSCYDAIAKCLLRFLDDDEKRSKIIEENMEKILFGTCPHCKSELASAGGSCRICLNCDKFYTCI